MKLANLLLSASVCLAAGSALAQSTAPIPAPNSPTPPGAASPDHGERLGEPSRTTPASSSSSSSSKSSMHKKKHTIDGAKMNPQSHSSSSSAS